MRSRVVLLLLGITFLAAGCLAPGSGGPVQTPTPVTTSPPAQLKYLLLDTYGESRFFYCDPDYYPVARDNEQERAIAIFPSIENETDVLSAITARKGLRPPYPDDAKLVIYREYKKLNAIPLEPAGDGSYTFSLRLGTQGQGAVVTGTIRGDGTILGERTETVVLTCPVCLAGETLIDTPAGPVPVREVRIGMPVWSLREDGIREAVPVAGAGRTGIPPGHLLVRLHLSDGRELSASPGHPLADGRPVGSLSAGDRVDGSLVLDATLVPVQGEFTYDVLPAGDTGMYWANGIPLRSTLSPPA